MKSLFKMIRARYALAWVGFFGTFTVYFCRLNLSIAVVSMVKEQRSIGSNSNVTICSQHQTMAKPFDHTTHVKERLGQDFDWSIGQQGDLLASYYYGYIWTQAAGPMLASSWGYKKVWLWTMLLASILTMVTPQLAYAGYGWLLASRVLIGLCHGVSFPCMHGMVGYWAPPMERSKLVSIYVSGASIGTCVLFPLAGLLIFSLGWPWVFYFTGFIGLLWCLVWTMMVYDSIEKHPWISNEEKEFLKATRVSVNVKQAVPWKKILSSTPVIAVAAGHLASNWGNYQLNSLLPTYLANVLNYDIKSNGFISSLPFIAQSVVCFIGGYLTDYVRQRDLCQTLTIRKINTALGLVIPAVTVVLAGYSGCNAPLAISFFILSVGFNTFTVPGCKTAPLDFAPDQAGAIFSVTNTVANLSGFLAPQITGHLLDMDNSISQWQISFWISALVYIPGFILFQIWGTDQLQAWN